MNLNRALAWVAAVGASLIVGCSSDEESAPGGSTATDDENQIGGLEVPSTTPVCAQGGQLTVFSGADAAFGWSAVDKATQYGIKISKSAKGATTESVVVDLLVPAGPKLQVTAGEGEAGAFYRIEGVAFEGTTALCLLDGANGIQK